MAADTPPVEGRRQLEAPPAATLERIMEGAHKALSRNGLRRLSMADICEACGMSRGTLYRYFASKEDIVAALSEHISTSFERGVQAVADRYDDPQARLTHVLRFHFEFTAAQSADLLEADPRFTIAFFRSHFPRHVQALRRALEPSFDAFDRQGGRRLDRDRFAEALVRLELSTMLIPANREWRRAPDMAAYLFSRFLPPQA